MTLEYDLVVKLVIISSIIFSSKIHSRLSLTSEFSSLHLNPLNFFSRISLDKFISAIKISAKFFEIFLLIQFAIDCIVIFLILFVLKFFIIIFFVNLCSNLKIAPFTFCKLFLLFSCPLLYRRIFQPWKGWKINPVV